MSTAPVSTLSLASLPSDEHRKIRELVERLSLGLQGKQPLIEMAVSCFLAGGHLLLEGPPGTGKTSLAKGLARASGGTFSRVQMTSDLLPSDIVGILRIRPGSHELEFREGPIFANFVLADEINRTSPKTQSSLLEAMEEATVTVDGKTYSLPRPFFVVATENPLEYQGVYPFAESQLDRFMMQLEFSAPTEDDEQRIYANQKSGHDGEWLSLPALLETAQTVSIQKKIQSIFIEATVVEYVTKIVRKTRDIPGVSHGVSVRGGLQFLSAVKAYAFVKGREFVTPEDVRALAPVCLAHRLYFMNAETQTLAKRQLIDEILRSVPVPK